MACAGTGEKPFAANGFAGRMSSVSVLLEQVGMTAGALKDYLVRCPAV
jgi:hypothetical protein